MGDLDEHAHNVHSQFGEDGVLAEIFRRLEISEGYFTEFGAWDGQHLSNAYALVEAGWSGCYIEGDSERYRQLCANIPQRNIHKIHRYVAVDGPDSLDSILEGLDAPREFDLLSIDIDSDDLAIWRGLARRRPKCVVIEYNPTIPFDCAFENPRERQWGNSARSIDVFAASHGYALVAITGNNLIYLDEQGPLAKAGVEPIALSDASPGPRYFWGYDGSLLVARPSRDDGVEDYAPELFRVPWANTIAVQPLPKLLRGYHDQQTASALCRTAISAGTAAILRPFTVTAEVRKRLRRSGR